jgi:hypothetical protein
MVDSDGQKCRLFKLALMAATRSEMLQFVLQNATVIIS